MRKKTSKEPRISGHEIHKRVVKRLAAYDDLNLLERFAMFLGKAQVLEFGLKSLLERRYNYQQDQMERWTLGKTVTELEKSGVRSDLIALLRTVVDYRNYIAHDALAGLAMLNIVLKGDVGRLGIKHLERGIYELERVILLHDWCEKHGAWGAGPNLPSPAPTPV